MGSKSLPPLPPPMGRPVRLFLKICSKPRNLRMHRLTRGMEPQAALVGADGAVELHAVAAVHLHLALIVHPGHAEKDRPAPAPRTAPADRPFRTRDACQTRGKCFPEFPWPPAKIRFRWRCAASALPECGKYKRSYEYPFLFSRAPCPSASGPRRFAPSHESPSLYHKPGARYALRVHLVCIFLRPYRDRGTVKACSGSCSIRPSWWEMTSVLA